MERLFGIARISPRSAGSHFGRLLATAAIASALAACGGGDHDDGDEPAVPSTSATVGAAGGTVIGPDDLRIVVPAGALSADTVITVRKSGVGAPALPAGVAASSPTPALYELTPHGLTFDAPVTISMPSTLDPGVNPVLMAQPGAEWELVNATAEAGRVSWRTTHFSWSYFYPCGASYPPGTPIPPNGPAGCQFPNSGVLVTAQPAAAMTGIAPDQYRVTDAADVTVKFSYSAPLDCINPAIKTWRFKRPATVPAGVTTTAVVLTRTPVNGIPGAFRLTGSTDVPFRFEYADNGNHVTGFFFACQGGITVGGNVLFTVAAPQPPAMPVAPTITQQPANASVLTGTTATFDVLATASDNLSIRWERKEPGGSAFAAVPGAAPLPGGSRLSVAAVLADSGATYRAQVCNSLRGVDNCLYANPATLTVTTTPPPPVTSATPSRLNGAYQSVCGISATGTVLCWGENGAGELGRGSNQPADGTPVAAVGLTGVTSIGASRLTTCAVHGGGRVSCWGHPVLGQGTPSSLPVERVGVTDARLVRVTTAAICTVDADRRIRCNGSTEPLKIDGQVVEDALDVAFLPAGRCVLLGSGEARCAMFDGSGELRTSLVEPMVRSLVPPGVNGIGTPFCFVLQSGSVRCWGTNANGQLGRGDGDTSVTQGTIPGIGPALQVAVGTQHACALTADRTVSCWGSGYLGNGAGFEVTQSPRVVNGLVGIVEIAAGFDTTCALRDDGVVLCWGNNSAGSIGTGTLGAAVLVPTPTVAGAAFVH